MANYYTLFSLEVEGTQEQRAWLYDALTNAEDYACEVEEQGEKLWIYSEENCDLDIVASVLADYQEKYHLDDPIVLEWANTCSKLRTDGFGGGAVAIHKGTLEWFNPSDQAARWIAERRSDATR